MKGISTRGLAPFAMAMAICAGNLAAQGQGEGPPEIIPHRTNPHEAGAPTAGSTGSQLPVITYHGGPVMGTPTVYLIWYGNWNQSNGSDTATGQALVRDFLHGLNNSPYYMINSSYGVPTGSVVTGAQYSDNYSQGARLSDSSVQAVVSGAISTGKLPHDTNGIYLVLSSSDVSEKSGFCTRYCGWHTAGTIAGSNIKYGFIGNANRCLNACSAQTTSPNGNAGVDGMISVMAHEIEESNTDPNPVSGWADAHGSENGDKCAWTFGANLQIAPNGGYFNMSLPTIAGGTRNYLVQRNLDANSFCYVNYLTRAQ
jgi:hypothetical protein